MSDGLNVLQEADRITSVERAKQLGPAKPLYEMIGRCWGALLGGHPIDPEDVALMLAVMKCCREVCRHNRDNLVDIAGYARVVEMLGEAGDEK